MKHLIAMAALSVALVGFAEDYYLFFQLPEEVTVDGQTLDSATAYYAQIKTSGGTYLNLYDEVGGANFGTQYEFTGGDASGMMFAGVFSDPTTASFCIELYNAAQTGSAIGYYDITDNLASFITSAGMGTPTSPYAVPGNFSSVPEPTSGVLLLLGVAGLALRRKNKKA